VKFDPPIRMELPNTDGLAPGTVVELFSFHHDVEQFVTEGTARVSKDGSVVVSDPGFGLTVSGWHGSQTTPPLTGGAGGGPGSGPPCNLDPLSITAKADNKDKDFKLIGDTVNLSASIAGSCNSPTWDWDFGDNGPHGSVQNPSHLYSQPGAYTVTAHVSCENSCSAPRTADATVDVTAIKLTLTEVSWTGNGQNQMMKTGSGTWDGAPYATDGDTQIVNPVWQSNNGTITT
jgi:PKD repeat protein